MTAAGPGPDDYIVRHVRDALAGDPRALELGVEVAVAGDRLILSGTVATPAQRRSIVEVAAEVAPGHRVVDELAVVPHDEAGDTEELS